MYRPARKESNAPMLNKDGFRSEDTEKFYVSDINTVFPHIIAAATILFWNLRCGNYSKEETIQGRKLLIFAAW